MGKPMQHSPFASQANESFDRTMSRLHKFYIAGTIEGPEEYVDWFEEIRSAGPDDVIVLHINSFGGDLFTAIQFMRVLNESKATIVTSAEGAVYSAATLLFLAGQQFEISPHCSFMFHNYSKMAQGKGGELYDNITFERKWSENLMREAYKDFLSEGEIMQLLDGKDVWMEGAEVVKRLQARAAKQQEAAAVAALPPKVPKKKPAKKVAKKKVSKKIVVPIPETQ